MRMCARKYYHRYINLIPDLVIVREPIIWNLDYFSKPCMYTWHWLGCMYVCSAVQCSASIHPGRRGRAC